MGRAPLVQPAQAKFNERAKYRLRIAAQMLRARGVDFPANGDFYGQVLQALEVHPDRTAIKELVDWAEEFDPSDELSGKTR